MELATSRHDDKILPTHIFGLEVLQNGANRPGSCGKRRVETVDVCLLEIGLLLDAEANLEITALVVRAVAAADQLLELSLML